MRLYPLFIAAPAISAFLATATLAEDTSKESMVGGWRLLTQPDAKAVDLCILQSPKTAEGLQLRIANRLNPDAKGSEKTRGAAQVRIVTPDKLSDQPTAVIADVSFKVPDRKSWEHVSADWQANQKALSAFLDDHIDRILPPISMGKQFEVSFALPDGQSKHYVIPLKGSFAAISAYEQCLATVTWVSPKK